MNEYKVSSILSIPYISPTTEQATNSNQFLPTHWGWVYNIRSRKELYTLYKLVQVMSVVFQSYLKYGDTLKLS